jgi:hypothetical protein
MGCEVSSVCFIQSVNFVVYMSAEVLSDLYLDHFFEMKLKCGVKVRS